MSRRRPRIAHAAYALAIALPVIWAMGHLFPPLNHDAALILDVAGRWIDGEALYVDVVDVNPPLIFALSTLPAWLAEVTDLSAPILFVLMVMGFVVLSVALCARLLSHQRFGFSSRLLWMPLALFLLAVFPGKMFGQREHLMLVAALPYLLLAGAHAGGRKATGRLEIGAALFAGFGFALKPYFLAAPALIEAYLLLADRRSPLNRRTLALATGPLAHLAIIAFLTPAYVTDVVPLVTAYYVEKADAIWDFATGPAMLPAILAWAVFSTIAFTRRSFSTQRVLSLFTLGGIISAVVQAKGWGYQSLPAHAGLTMLVSLTLSGLLERGLSPRRLHALAPLAIVGILIPLYALVFAQGLPFREQREFAGGMIRHLARVMAAESYDHRVMILSPGVSPIFPAVNYAEVRTVMPQDSLWVLQGVYDTCRPGAPRYNAFHRMPPAEHKLFDTLVRKIAIDGPSVLIVDKETGIPPCDGMPFSFLDYFNRDPRFARAMQDYGLVSEFDRYLVFRRYVE